MSGVAAVVAGSRARARRASTAAASNRAAARLEDASYFGKHHMEQLFARHDTSGTGQLTQAQLKLLLEEVNGEPLSQLCARRHASAIAALPPPPVRW